MKSEPRIELIEITIANIDKLNPEIARVISAEVLTKVKI